MKKRKLRSRTQFILDFISFPIRAVSLFERDLFIFSSLRTERFNYVAHEIKGRVLDVGCGRENYFIKNYANRGSKGIDVFAYKGLKKNNLVKDLIKFPFKKESFSTVTFIASINHVPEKQRDKEISEAYRVLTKNGRIIITMGNPLAEVMVHKLVYFYDKFFKTNVDMDSERGMKEGESYFLTDNEIISRLKKARFKNIRKKYFISQWFLNHMFVAEK